MASDAIQIAETIGIYLHRGSSNSVVFMVERVWCGTPCLLWRLGHLWTRIIHVHDWTEHRFSSHNHIHHSLYNSLNIRWCMLMASKTHIDYSRTCQQNSYWLFTDMPTKLILTIHGHDNNNHIDYSRTCQQNSYRLFTDLPTIIISTIHGHANNIFTVDAMIFSIYWHTYWYVS